MNILGIFFMGYDPSAALIKDGKLIAVAEEERFIGIKHAKDFFPINSIKFCLNYSGLNMEDIDFISVGWGAFKYPHYLRKIYKNIDKIHKKDKFTKEWEEMTLREHNEKKLINKIVKNLISHGISYIPKIKFVEHHLAHASSAFFCSGFDEAVILTVDGHGDENCTVGWYFSKSGDIRKIFEINIPSSLGWFYSAFTEFLGFNHKGEEGKVMGLAPYGDYNKEIFEKIRNIVYNGCNYKIDPSYIFYGMHSYSERFTNKMVYLFDKPRKKNEKITQKYKEIAYAVQSILEEHLFYLVEYLVKETGCNKLCMAGGVALNSKAIGFIWSKGIVKDIFIQPLAGDGGTSIGSAFIVYKKETGKTPNFKLNHTYYGPKYSNGEIEKKIESKNIQYRVYDESELAKIIAEKIAKGKIIGLFRDRMEFGPRALGNRSILADPRDPTMWSKVNEIKGRELWRPLAPSILEEKANEYLIKNYKSPFMSLCFEIFHEKIRDIPAVVHIDNTARFQTVSKNHNPFFWNIINNFHSLTGIPLILNTSFNKAGKPLVCSPNDALNCYEEMKLDSLIINNFLITQ